MWSYCFSRSAESRDGWPDRAPLSVRTLSDALPARAWRRVAWRNGANPPWEADFAARRVTPTTDWRHRRLAPEVWLLCERGLGPTGRRRHYLVSLPAPRRSPSWCGWRISAGPSNSITRISRPSWDSTTWKDAHIPGFEHHVVISAIAYAFLQQERRRPSVDPALTFPAVRAIEQEVVTGLLFASRPTYMKWLNEAQATYHLRI